MSASTTQHVKRRTDTHANKVSEMLDMNSLQQESMLASVTRKTSESSDKLKQEEETDAYVVKTPIKRVLSFQKVEVNAAPIQSSSTLSQQLESRRTSLGHQVPPGLRVSLASNATSSSMSTGMYKSDTQSSSMDNFNDPFVIPGMGLVDLNLNAGQDTVLRCSVFLPTVPRAHDKLPYFVQLTPPNDCSARQLVLLCRQQFHTDLNRLRVRAPQQVDPDLAAFINANVAKRHARDGVTDVTASPRRNKRGTPVQHTRTVQHTNTHTQKEGDDSRENSRNSQSSTREDSTGSQQRHQQPQQAASLATSSPQHTHTLTRNTSSAKKVKRTVRTKDEKECLLEAGFLLEDVFVDSAADYELVVWSEQDGQVNSDVPPVPAFARIATCGFDTFALQKTVSSHADRSGRRRNVHEVDNDSDDEDDDLSIGRSRTSSHVPPRPPTHLMRNQTQQPQSWWERLKRRMLCCGDDTHADTASRHTHSDTTSQTHRYNTSSFSAHTLHQSYDPTPASLTLELDGPADTTTRYSSRYGVQVKDESDDDDISIADLGLPIAKDANLGDLNLKSSKGIELSKI